MVASNYWAPDGYRYGVMYADGSVAARWSGRTQRARAQENLEQVIADLTAWLGRPPRDLITLARCQPGEPWERISPDA